MSFHKKQVLLAFLLASCTLLIGCLHARSLDEYGYTMVIGVDRGEEKEFFVSMLIQRGGGDAPGRAQEQPVAGVECEDIFEAVELLEGSLPYKLNLSRTTAIVCSADMARGDGLGQFLNASLRTLQIRYYTNLIVAYGEASDFLKGMQNELMPNLEKLQYSFVDLSKTTGAVPSITLQQFYDRAYHWGGDASLPLGITEAANTDRPRGGLPSTLNGSAVFSGTKMVGTLSGEQTKLMLMATGEFREGRMQIPLDNGGDIRVRFSRKDRPIVDLEWVGAPKVWFSLSFYATVERGALSLSVGDGVVERLIADHLKNELTSVYYTCRDLGSDVFAVGKAAATRFFDAEAFERFDWKGMFLKTDAEFDVAVRLEYDPARAKGE